MTHAHHHCSHTVIYCAKCNVCYCTQCGQEWGRPVWHYSYPYVPYTVPSWPWGSTTAGSTFGLTKTSGGTCTHAS